MALKRYSTFSRSRASPYSVITRVSLCWRSWSLAPMQMLQLAYSEPCWQSSLRSVKKKEARTTPKQDRRMHRSKHNEFNRLKFYFILFFFNCNPAHYLDFFIFYFSFFFYLNFFFYFFLLVRGGELFLLQLKELNKIESRLSYKPLFCLEGFRLFQCLWGVCVCLCVCVCYCFYFYSLFIFYFFL